VVRSDDVEWLTVNDVGWECLRLVNSSPPGTREPCSADSDALPLPVCCGYVPGRRASAVPRAASVTSRGRTGLLLVEVASCLCSQRDKSCRLQIPIGLLAYV